MSTLTSPKKTIRLLYHIFLVTFLVAGIVFLISIKPYFRANDFLEYWSASKLILSGGNPYDSNSLFEMQKLAGIIQNQPIIFYLPPLIFPFIVIFCLFSFQTAQLLWLLINIYLLLICIRYIWQLYGGFDKHTWFAWVVGFTFAPVYIAIGNTGQISPLILSGVIGFLYFIQKPRTKWIAGFFATLILTKPQLTYLFIITFLIWSIAKKQWQLLLGFSVSLLFENLFAFILNPSIYNQYYHLMMTGLHMQWASPAIGSVLRMLFGIQHTWLQYAPMAIGLIWLVFWGATTKNIDWSLHTPLILLVSTVTAAYAWTYDQVILLVPVLFTISALFYVHEKRAKLILYFFLIINLIAWILRIYTNDFWFFWLAPCIWVWYLSGHKYLHNRIKVEEISPFFLYHKDQV